jgi:hypothetical protein
LTHHRIGAIDTAVLGGDSLTLHWLTRSVFRAPTGIFWLGIHEFSYRHVEVSAQTPRVFVAARSASSAGDRASAVYRQLK